MTKGKVSQEAGKRIQDLGFLSRTAMGFLDLPREVNIYEFIAQQLKALVGKSFVIVTSFDEATGSACVRAILGLGRNTAAVMRMLGKHPLGMSLAIDKEARLGLGAGKLTKVPGGLFEYCFKRIPKAVCHAIEKLLNLGDIYAMGFIWKGKLFGSTAILTHRGSILQDQALIETFIKQASVALQRWHAEEALKKAHDEMEARVDKRTRELVKVNKQLLAGITERKRVEEALMESEKRYRDLADLLPQTVFELDERSNLIFVNRNAFDMFCYSQEDFDKGLSAIQMFIPGDRDRAKENIKRRLRGEKFGINEYTALRKDGSIFPVLLHSAPIIHEGKPIGLRGIIIDITERKRIEEALRESENKYRTIFETTGAATVIIDEDMTISLINKECEKLVGYSKEEVEGKRSWTEFVVKDDLEKAKEYHRLRRIAPNTAPRNYECRVMDKWGNVKIVLVTIAMIPDTKKSLASVLDITEHRQVAEAMQKSEQKFRGFIEQSRDGITLVDERGAIIEWNRGEAEITGLKKAEVLGRPIWDVQFQVAVGGEKTRAKSARRKAMILESLRTGQAPWFNQISESNIQRPDETLRTIQSVVFPIKTGKGLMIGSVTRDITEHKQMRERLTQSREQLRSLYARLQSVREEERASVSREIHDELGQSLTALKMDLFWMRRRLSTEQEELIEKADSMVGIIDNTIKSVKRISSALRPGILDDLGIVAAIEWEVEEFQKRTGVKCKLDLMPEETKINPRITTTIFRILQEALTNIARHANATKVNIGLRRKADKLELKIRDNGKGITKKQIHNSKSFGLMGMRERIEYLRGEFKITGIRGKGTTLVSIVPLNQKGKAR